MQTLDSVESNLESTSTALLRLVVNRDEAAWAKFFELYEGLILSRCRSMKVRPCDCPDIVQVVLERVHRAIPSFQRDGEGRTLRRWLRTITRNVILDYLRSLPPERNGLKVSELAALQSVFDSTKRRDSAHEISNSDLVLELRPIVELVRINYEQRTWDAFWRTAIEGEPTTDVSADLEMSMNSVRQARHKILNHLRRELSDLNEML